MFGEEITLALFQKHQVSAEAYAIVGIGVVGTLMNGFLATILFHSLLNRRLVSQKIVYLNLVLAETLFSLVGCTLRGPGLITNLCSSPDFCKFARYTESYISKTDMLCVIPITASILLITTRGVNRCTAPLMLSISGICWIIPGLYLGSFALRGYLEPGTFHVVHVNDSVRCNFGGSEYHQYVLGESVLFFYFPTLACALMYCIVGYYQAKYRVLGVAKLVRRGVWVTFFYCVCWIPFVVVYTISQHHELKYNVTYLLSITYVFYYFSVIANPLTYIVTSKFFQHRLINYLINFMRSGVEDQQGPIGRGIEVGRNHEGGVIETSTGVMRGSRGGHDVDDDMTSSDDDEMIDAAS